MLTRKAAAEILGMSVDSVYKYGKMGRLKTVLSEAKGGGKQLLYEEEDVLRVKKELEAERRGKKRGKKPGRKRLPRSASERPGAAPVQSQRTPEPAALDADRRQQEPAVHTPSLPPHYKAQVLLDADIFEEFERRFSRAAESRINEALRVYLLQGIAGGERAEPTVTDQLVQAMSENEQLIQTLTERVSARMASAVAARASA